MLGFLLQSLQEGALPWPQCFISPLPPGRVFSSLVSFFRVRRLFCAFPAVFVSPPPFVRFLGSHPRGASGPQVGALFFFFSTRRNIFRSSASPLLLGARFPFPSLPRSSPGPARKFRGGGYNPLRTLVSSPVKGLSVCEPPREAGFSSATWGVFPWSFSSGHRVPKVFFRSLPSPRVVRRSFHFFSFWSKFFGPLSFPRWLIWFFFSGSFKPATPDTSSPLLFSQF